MDDEFAAFSRWRDVYNNRHLGSRTAAAVLAVPGELATGEGRVDTLVLLREVAITATGAEARSGGTARRCSQPCRGQPGAVWRRSQSRRCLRYDKYGHP